MSTEHRQDDGQLLARWIRVTSAGWLLGVVIIVSAGVIGDVVGRGEGDSQCIVGLGIGAGVGYAQGRVARRWPDGSRHWAWTSVIGMGLPFVGFDFAGAVWNQFPDVVRLLLEVGVGGLLVGLLQWRPLRRHSVRAGWWVPASVAGWTLAAATAASGPLLNVRFLGKWFFVALNLATILLGGVVLGLVTGTVLVWIRRC